MFRPEDFAELTTPAAPNRKGNIFFMARPPLLCEEGNNARFEQAGQFIHRFCEEGNLLSAAGFVLNFGFVKYVDTLMRRGIALSAFLFLRLIRHRLGCPFDS